MAILLDCKQMARSVFYYHRKRLRAQDKYKQHKEEIIRIYHLHKGRYGYRRITAEMNNRGYGINHKTVQKLMSITPETKEKLFSFFFTTKAKGQGIGLMFVREVLSSHGCKFSLTSENGLTKFVIEF